MLLMYPIFKNNGAQHADVTHECILIILVIIQA